MKPRARRQKLVVQALPEETLVYDLERDKAHCLAPTLAAIWRHCDGRRTVAEIIRAVKAEGHVADEAAVQVAVRRLLAAHLLETPVEKEVVSGARRDLLRKAAAVGGLSILSMVSPRVSQAASCAPAGTCVSSMTHLDPSGRPCCSGRDNPGGSTCGTGGGFTRVCCANPTGPC